MDAFLSTVESQGFPLSVLDTQTSFSNIPYIFFYENSDGSPDFMDSDALRTAFYKTLAKYPILAGHIRMDGHGQAKVVVDKDDLNMPEYLETAVDDISYSAIKAAQFSTDTWPSGVATVGPIARAGAGGSLKLLNVHVVRLKNNSGAILFVNIPHYVVDGIGFFGFVNRWAEQTRNPEADIPSPCFDRSEIDSHLSGERREQCDFIQKLYTTPTIPATFLAWLSPNSRGRILDKAMNMISADGHTFLVTRQKLDSLRQQVLRHVSSGMRVSDNDLLTALIAKTMAQAQKSTQTMFGRLLNRETEQGIALICDIRHRIGMADIDYSGNALTSQSILNRLEQVEMPTTIESLATIVESVRRAVDDLDAPLIAGFIDLINLHPTGFTRPMAYAASHRANLLVSNQTRFRMYDADFGHGAPALVTPIPIFVANVIAFMPSPPPSKDVRVFVSAESAVMQAFLTNEFCSSILELMY
ncbi:hypothetical protein EC988_000186 [Linderina pennispora]|nr:hypothetical protein EC988_000186 [Linderina pennispora]